MSTQHAGPAEEPAAVPGRLRGTVSVVTGASGGLGRGIADRLAAEGSAVACLDIREPDVPWGENQHYFGCDVTDEDAIVEVVGAIADRLGGVDILVNNAGLLSGRGSYLDVSAQEMHRYFAVNAVGALLMVQACHDHLVRSPWRGRVINIASRTFFTGNAGQLAYIASKGALTGMTRVLAHELGAEGVTVNAVMPAQVATPGTRAHSGDEVFAATRDKQAIKEFVTPAHFAGMVAYLASPDGVLVTGQTMVCDGGGLMK
ncbi:SDR family NAD(P)-dependent oxidoreductase [Nesterenkonia flava]|uniref:SDR family oxidoreductase n=1 Tax=Nesterenkonia flava TaxID=469799 RepID=A0ABU1FPM5_9MICC|nr:SDR family oxidoreductase [Nesterenkonia flava]MDR5710592.1 SDR family oxidoreductase [Nesterenkonia flava]